MCRALSWIFIASVEVVINVGPAHYNSCRQLQIPLFSPFEEDCLQTQRKLDERHDFWLSCGHHLLDRDADGWLPVTDEFLKVYLARPELTPPPDACTAERALHQALLTDPRGPVAPDQLAAIVDEDARENWEQLIAWRDQLVSHVTLEAAYLDIVTNVRRFPYLFINQLVQVILRNILDDCGDVFMLRAAELFFRPQKLTVQEGTLLCADEETIENLGTLPMSPLVLLLGLPGGAQMTALSESNAGSYWDRSDMFDLALDLTAGRRGLAALGDVIVAWVTHLLAVNVKIVPVSELRQVAFRWYVGLDGEATRIGDALWAGEELNETTQSQLVGLFELSFADPAVVDAKIGGAPTYLLLAMTKDQRLRLKPQNILSGLPIRRSGSAQ
jgi:hypothetical protein